MGYLKRVFWGVILASFFAGEVHAAPAVIGGEIYYDHLGSGKYAVTVIAYRGCGNNPVGYTPIVTMASGSVFHSGGKGPVLIGDITPVCKTACTLCSNSSCSFGFGFEKYIFQDTVDLSGTTDCDFTFSWSPGYRASSITTGPASTAIYLESTLNRCRTGDHSSARYGNNPRFILEKATCTSFYENGIPNEKDSLSYEQIMPLTPPTYVSAKYASGYGYDYPIRYSGYPTRTWKPASCEGFSFDKTTGRLDFKPTKNEVSVFVFRMHQYQKNGSAGWQEVGSVVREYEVTVTNSSGNRYPAISNSQGKTEKVIICQDEVNDKLIAAFDPDGDDTARMTSNTTLPGAVIDMDKKWSYLSWKPDSSAVQEEPYEAILTVKDDACPLPGVAQQRYLFYVKPPFPKYTLKITDSPCYTRYFEVEHDTSIHFKYKWWLDNIPKDSTRKWSHQFDTNGNYVLRLQITSPAGCVRNEYHTISITNVPYFTAGEDTQICYGYSAHLHASGGLAYYWQNANNTLSSTTVPDPIATPSGSKQYIVVITDSNGCQHKRYVNVIVKDFDIVPSFVRHQIYCKNSSDSALLRTYNGLLDRTAKKFRWWTNAGFSDSTHITIKVAPAEKTTYYIKVWHPNGCEKTDSIVVEPDSVVAVVGPDQEICYGEGVQLSVSGGTPVWDPAPGITTLNSYTPFVNPLSSQYYKVKVYKGKCFDTDSVLVKVNKVEPKITGPTASICRGDTVQLKITGGNAYAWTPAALMIGSNTPTPKAFPLATTKFKVYITDTLTGCKAEDTVTVFVKNDCIWPGDANHDGRVNYEDLLHLGVGFGDTGPKRQIVSTNWEAFEGSDWPKTTDAGINEKHIDFNGDGHINMADTLAFQLNYGKTNANTSGHNYNNAAARIYFSFNKDTFYPGDTVNAGLYIGGTNPGFYGIALTYHYTEKVMVPGSYKFSFDKRPGYVDLSMHRFSAGIGEAAIVGTNHSNSFQETKVGSIRFQLRDSSYFQLPEWMELSVLNALVIDKAGKVYQAKTGNAMTIISRVPDTPASIAKWDGPQRIDIFPNPASSSFTIRAQTRVLKITIEDMLGRNLIEESGYKAGIITINTSKITDGIYAVSVYTEKGIIQQRIIIRH